MGFPGGSEVTNLPANAGDVSLIPGSGRSPGSFLEKEMAAHSSTLSWKRIWTEEPGGLQSMGITKSLNNNNNTYLYLHLRKSTLKFFKLTSAGRGSGRKESEGIRK